MHIVKLNIYLDREKMLWYMAQSKRNRIKPIKIWIYLILIWRLFPSK